jgi:hypothetical protein
LSNWNAEDTGGKKEKFGWTKNTNCIAIYSSMATSKDAIPRNDLYETLKLSRLPDTSKDGVKRFISHTPAWKPGQELPWAKVRANAYKKGDMVDFPPAAYGGHVYAQAPLAAARAVEEDEETGSNGNSKPGIHVSFDVALLARSMSMSLTILE